MISSRTNPFRHHWTLDPEVRFLNHGSFGACPAPVLQLQAELRARIEREPIAFLARALEGELDRVRESLGTFLGAQPEDIVFVPNATTGVNAVLRSLQLEPGDQILVTNQGYNACSNAVQFVCERAGARQVVARVPFPLRSPDDVVEAVLAAVTPRTRLAVVDHITSPTGLVYPIERIVRELAERGVDTLVDGAHAPGMLALDLPALAPAYYTGNAHKWLCAPKGAGFLWARRDRQKGLRPVVISHGANDGRTNRSRYRIEFDWVGTMDPTPYLCIPEALRFLGSLLPGGWDELRSRNRALALFGRRQLLSALKVEAPAPEEMIGALASVPLPLLGGEAPKSAFEVDPLQSELFDQHRIEVPVFPWPSPTLRLVRISAQVYNDEEDYVALAEILSGLK